MTRPYMVFGSDDGVYWELLNTIPASGAAQALNKAREQEDHRHYAAVPERNWTQGTPEVVERPPVVRWTTVAQAQMTVGEAIDAAKDAAKEALGIEEKEEEKEEEVIA